MKYINTIIAVILLCVATACNKDDVADNTPACISNEIKSHDRNWAVGRVDEYSFQGKIVYAFEPDGNIIADGSTAIWEDNCHVLCSVGGFGGPDLLLCNGVKFYEQATYRRTIWKK